jgi:hypothetical protein
MMCSINIDESVIPVFIAAWSSCLCVLLSKKLEISGAYPEFVTDIVLCNGDEDKGTTSAETLVPRPIKTDVHGRPKPSVVDQASIKPSTGGRCRKRLRTVVK